LARFDLWGPAGAPSGSKRVSGRLPVGSEPRSLAY